MAPPLVACLQSYVYVLSDGMMGDPSLIVGHGPLDIEEDDGDEFDVMFDDEEEPAEAGTGTGTTAPPPAPEGDDRTEL